MNYQQAKENTFAKGSCPDGYAGERANIEFYFDPESGKTFCVADHGLFGSLLPQCASEAEAAWYLVNHPKMCRYYRNAKLIKEF